MVEQNRNILRIGMTAPELVVCLVSQIKEVNKILFRKVVPINNLAHRERSDTLDQKMLHRPNNIFFQGVWMNRDEVNLERLMSIKLQKEEVLCITSKFECGGKILHLPMLDFECTICPENQKMISDFIKRILGHGIILESGQSYHVYGQKLINEPEMINFLGRSLLFKDYSDIRYIGHRLIDRELCLRLTANLLKPDIPHVVCWV